jgi:hypothetical protein
LALNLSIQTVIQVITRGDLRSKDFNQEWSQYKQAQLAQEAAQSELPTFIYSYNKLTDQLHRTSLVTGEHSSYRLPSYTFELGCSWSEVPGGSLLITGGGWRAVREVVRIDTRRELAVAHRQALPSSEQRLNN